MYKMYIAFSQLTIHRKKNLKKNSDAETQVLIFPDGFSVVGTITISTQMLIVKNPALGFLGKKAVIMKQM